jgi:hypothetical protein
MTRLRRVAAFSFRSPFTLADIFEALNGSGPWHWRNRDNDSWGDYISSGVLPKPHYGIVKIIEEDTSYVLNMHVAVESSDATELATQFSAVQNIVLTRILPRIEADRIKPTDARER